MQRGNGFTLLEIMLVLIVLGMMYSVVIPNIRGTDASDEIEQHSQYFARTFSLASEYALLNNLELGLYVKDNSYQFLVFNGQRWQQVPDQELFVNQSFNEPYALELTLDELDLDADAMTIDREMFSEFETEQSFDQGEEPIYPQVYLFSSGEITPFQLRFIFDDNFEQPIYFQVSASYSLPLTVQGPLDYEKG
ncbi:type II secretion system minor pseudopilin GspH [Thalassotalea ponticola]|uniref:type II secretion system minor pseudopilin GspH n=1 Tax=Thalassotalea ponticola TaxID=1523392 RepID=UPI0025B4EB6A|nr:type II secretion system minor pseudopilin GspH [Thalassotalea ponticola]MDN3652999.1 type II secretion system minor pseudopilin GspH [Thalassotalea ponticola]